jgi:hypothetical protein
MLYTAKLLVFTSMAGTEVVDVVPLAEITAVNIASEELTKGNRRTSALEELDNISDAGTGVDSKTSKTSKSALEVAILTEPEGYNSGRSYRVWLLLLAHSGLPNQVMWLNLCRIKSCGSFWFYCKHHAIHFARPLARL